MFLLEACLLALGVDAGTRYDVRHITQGRIEGKGGSVLAPKRPFLVGCLG